MSPFDGRLLHASNLLVGGTGIVYAVMRYLMTPTDEWAVVNHPWQPHFQHLHVLSAPFLVFAVGVIFKHHVLDKMSHNGARGRVTGLALVFQFIPMVLSGYLIQVSVSETWRSIWIWLHLITAGLWIVMLVAHLFRCTGRKDGEAASCL